MEDDRLLKILDSEIIDDDALGMIFSNYINIGGRIIGLTVDNAINAGKLLRKYDEMKSNK